MIEVKGLTKIYAEYIAISDISFKVQEGEIVGFLGPNGAGKTTTMKILTGFMPATYGTARVAGFDVFNDPDEVKRRVGYLPEFPPLYPDMTVRSYLDFAAQIKEVPRWQRPARVNRVMEATRISDVEDRVIGNLSRGYQQRVGIAQALVHDPAVLILDEPTVGLDPNQIREVRDLIRELRHKRTIILSTHILPEVSMTCERIIIVNRGRIVADGTEAELTRGLGNPGVYHLRVQGPEEGIPGVLSGIPGVRAVQSTGADREARSYTLTCDEGVEIRPPLFAELSRHGWPIFELRPPGISLEEVFTRLTTSDRAPAEVPPAAQDA